MREFLIETSQSLTSVKEKVYWIVGLFSLIFLVGVITYWSVSKVSPDGCVGHDHCAASLVCASQRCVDPCVGLCGPNTTCHVFNHVPVCSCLSGYSGHPVIGCSLSPPSPSPSPPFSETYKQTPPGKKRFYLSHYESDWFEALVSCLRNHSSLVSVDSMEELDELNRFIKEENGRLLGRYWTSGADIHREGRFLWVSSGKPIPLKTGLWRAGEPNDYDGRDEDCVELWEKHYDTDYHLNDVPCSSQINYICEYYEDVNPQ